jgi:chromosome segregation ATPase
LSGGYVEAIASAARNASKPAIDEPVKEAFRVLLSATIKGLDSPELAEVQAEKDKLQRRYHKLQAAHLTVNAQLAVKEKALGDAVKAGKAERSKRKQLETQIAELKAQVLTLQDQASVATGAETAEANPTAERQQRDELEAEVETERAINRGLQAQVTKLQAQVLMHEKQASEAAEAGRTDGAAQGAAEVEAALAEKNQELEKLKEALTEKDNKIERLKTALNML